MQVSIKYIWAGKGYILKFCSYQFELGEGLGNMALSFPEVLQEHLHCVSRVVICKNAVCVSVVGMSLFTGLLE